MRAKKEPTKEGILAIKDPYERQKMIAKHMDLFRNRRYSMQSINDVKVGKKNEANRCLPNRNVQSTCWRNELYRPV